MKKQLHFLFPFFKKKSIMEINFKKIRSYTKKLERQEKLEERKDIRQWIKSNN